MISARVVADSVNDTGQRITTILAEYPRFIHSELMTHRAFSRNAASSRAIPVETMIKRVEDNPAMPTHWGLNQKGMQAVEELNDKDATKARNIWMDCLYSTLFHVNRLKRLNAHKQVVNRLLEPYAHIATLITATEWSNFFQLRMHPLAQPEFQQLATAMFTARENSIPVHCEFNQWHLPFVHANDYALDLTTQQRISVARCARLSYFNVDGSSSSVGNDLALYSKLIEAIPPHASPAEHQATASTHRTVSRNFRGWVQLRELLECK